MSELPTHPITADQLDDMEMSFKIQCSFCYNDYEENIDLMADKSFQEQAAQLLNDAGWQMLETSEAIGLGCPDCQEKSEDEIYGRDE